MNTGTSVQSVVDRASVLLDQIIGLAQIRIPPAKIRAVKK